MIAIFFVSAALMAIGGGIMMLFFNNVPIGSVEIVGYLSAIVLVLIANAWFLSSSVLPIVRINSEGITAYSLCWTRRIAWKNVRILRLIVVKNKTRIRGANIYFEDSKSPETKSVAVLNKGIRVATYIVVSSQSWHKPNNTVANLYNHRTIAGDYAIAFEYDPQVWEMVNELAGRKIHL
jgi:hypothetical protein